MEANRERWEAEFKKWEKSGLTRNEYCKQHDISISTFDYWRGRIKKRTATKELVRLPIPYEAVEPSPIILELPNGIRIQIPAGYQRETLKEILEEVTRLPLCL